MKNSKLRRALLLVACAVLLVAVSVSATLAYLVDNDSVENTFTVGHIYIHLDEKNTDDVPGEQITDCDSPVNHNGRDQQNTYHILPAATFDKDPIVWVDADSEKAFLFIKVRNEIAKIESTSEETIDQQITKAPNTWTLLESTFIENEGYENVYWCLFEPNGRFELKGEDYKVPTFEHVYITSDLDNADMDTYQNAKVTVTAYAIQYDGMQDDANYAWRMLNEQLGNQ